MTHPETSLHENLSTDAYKVFYFLFILGGGTIKKILPLSTLHAASQLPGDAVKTCLRELESAGVLKVRYLPASKQLEFMLLRPPTHRKITRSIPPPLPPHEAYPILEQACHALGITGCTSSSDYGKAALRKMYARLREGYTTEELTRAVDVAHERLHKGEAFSQLRSLLYIWGLGFPILIAPPITKKPSRVLQEAIRKAEKHWMLYKKGPDGPLPKETHEDEWNKLIAEKYKELVQSGYREILSD